jgi:diacylglycerol kinase family enzyme
MIAAQLLHNPGAGEGAYTKEALIELLEKYGYKCNYASTKEDGWDTIDEDAELVIIAGGDGTVRKVMQKLLERKMIEKKFPLAVLPMGTANNIGNTFYSSLESETVIKSWAQGNRKKVDIGRIEGLKKDMFFMEGFGIGVFPRLMKEMKRQEERHEKDPQAELKTAQELLHDLVPSYKPKKCSITIDGKDFSDDYVLVEVMNIRSVGPNLFLAPDADPTDGLLDVVLIPATEQEKLAIYMQHRKDGVEEPFTFPTVRGKCIELKWKGTHAHIDDKLIEMDKSLTLKIELHEGLIECLVE